MVAKLSIVVAAAKEENTKMDGVGSTRLGATKVTTSPFATLVATRIRMVVGAAFAMLGGVIRILLLSSMHGSVRTVACHFIHAFFFQNEHGAGLIKGKKRITLVIKVVVVR